MRRCHVRKSPCRGAHAEAACKVIQYARRFNTQDNSRRQAPGCTRCIRESFFINIRTRRMRSSRSRCRCRYRRDLPHCPRHLCRLHCLHCPQHRSHRSHRLHRPHHPHRPQHPHGPYGSTRTAGLPAPPARPGPPVPLAPPEAPSARLWQCRESVRMSQVRPLCFVALL